MTTITRRLDALEARSAQKGPICLFLFDPDETIETAWVRSYPGEPFDPDADFMVFSWMLPDERDGGEGR